MNGDLRMKKFFSKVIVLKATMLKVLLVTLFFLPKSAMSQSDPLYKGVRFEEKLSWQEIKDKARQENKYVFVDCYATWCGPCKMMDRDIYPHIGAGQIVADSFICVKVQMDSTWQDDSRIRSWYTDAKKIKKNYVVAALPTFLFFSPDGKLIHKDMGYKSVVDFRKMVQLSRDPRKPLMYAKYEDYKNGKKNCAELRELLDFTSELIGDKEMVQLMARDYYHNYLLRLESDSLFTKENIQFVMTYNAVLTPGDKYFSFFYDHPEKTDSIIGTPGVAKSIVEATIKRIELDSVLLAGNRSPIKLPGWNKLAKNIERKYPSIDVDKLMLDYKVNYYKNVFVDWTLWAKYKDIVIKKYPPNPPYGLQVYIDINAEGSWRTFLRCNEIKTLKKAVEWIDLAMRIDQEDSLKTAEYLDTKASLLYKLGKVDEAIKLESQSLDLLSDLLTRNKVNPDAIPERRIILDLMKSGKPTYLQDGADWDKAALARINNKNLCI